MDKYYKEIKQKLVDDEIYAKTKDYSKERHKVITYFETGKLLFEAGSKYGESIINNYSKKLVDEIGKKYNYRTLYRMRSFYKVFNNEKLTPLVSKLSWSHYIQLLSLNDIDEIIYYIRQSVKLHLSKNDLISKIKKKEYERLDNKTKEKLKNNIEEIVVSDLVKNPILIRNDYDYTDILEKLLKHLILEDMDNFLKELGDGFSYIGNEYKIKIGERYNFIDILLYNYIYNCFIVVELKVTELKSEYIGQITKYMNYIDKHVKTITQNKTIGIIICKKDNKFIMEYCSDDRIFTRVYEII